MPGPSSPAAIRWVIVHSAADYKTGGAMGDRPDVPLPGWLYPELEVFVEVFRCARRVGVGVSCYRGRCICLARR